MIDITRKEENKPTMAEEYDTARRKRGREEDEPLLDPRVSKIPRLSHDTCATWFVPHHDNHDPSSSMTQLLTGAGLVTGRKKGRTQEFVANHPRLIKQWHPSNSLSPQHTLVKAETLVRWKCFVNATCPDWTESVSKRAKVTTDKCPRCSMSKYERAVSRVLYRMKQSPIASTKPYTIESIKYNAVVPPTRYRYDFEVALESREKAMRTVLIEMDGHLHFNGVPNNDAKKNELARLMNRPLLRMDYKVPAMDYCIIFEEFFHEALVVQSQQWFMWTKGPLYLSNLPAAIPDQKISNPEQASQHRSDAVNQGPPLVIAETPTEKKEKIEARGVLRSPAVREFVNDLVLRLQQLKKESLGLYFRATELYSL